MKIKQVTGFPEEQGTSLEFQTRQPQFINVKIRYPYWAQKGLNIKVNSEPVKIETNPGSFVNIEREWHYGDRIEVKFPFTLRLETMPDDENRVAIMYGPLVMAGELGPVEDPKAFDIDYVPVLLTEERDPSSWLKSGESTNEFVLNLKPLSSKSFNHPVISLGLER